MTGGSVWDLQEKEEMLSGVVLFSSFYDQDLYSINFITTRGSPLKASSPEVPAHTDKSEYAGGSPGANPPTLKSDMKASPESQSSAFFETAWDSDCCVMGKRGILRVTPQFWGKRGCRGSLRSCVLRRRFLGKAWLCVGSATSCVLRHGPGESVAVVPRFAGWGACFANCRRPGLLASRPRAGMALCLLQEIGLADDVLVDEQDISAPVPPRTRLLRDIPVRRTLPSDICSPCLVSSTSKTDIEFGTEIRINLFSLFEKMATEKWTLIYKRYRDALKTVRVPTSTSPLHLRGKVPAADR
ncbi:hypothetical protein CUMW_156480 [Citrus unshiu]|uniref:Uncharacterized protein n=1 Tax=Citrus unshiu TaxID=55188 RepID=A0A2H5PPW8_CITUN|nr:hypothetical protein CUMW_156480 [Citrus unshiu]